MSNVRFMGFDVHAETIAVAAAEPTGELRSLGVIPNRIESIRKPEEARTGQATAGLLRSGSHAVRGVLATAALGVKCEVVAPTLVPVKAGDRVKTDRRDALKLARRGAVVIPGAGTVYFNAYRLSGPCGTLTAENGVLEATDGGSRRLPAPVRGDDVTISGDGWTFRVAPGWVVREGARRGDYEAVRQQP